MNLSLWSFAGLGLLLGVRHAFDADHLVAIATMVAEKGGWGRAARVGLLWGLGHTLTLLAAGLVAYLFSLRIPERWSHGFEAGVGVMLVILGVNAVIGGLRGSHGHEHSHDHVPGFGLRPLVVGIVHGLAGSGALTVLVLGAAPSVSAGLTYITLFGLGTIIAMMATSIGMAAPLAVRLGKGQGVTRALRLAAGAASTALGLVMVVEMGRAFLG